MTLFVLSVVGSDRPGLTRALAAAVLSAGGNWLESHLSRLGGLYVGSVLVELAAGDAEALRTAVGAVDADGLEVRVAPALDEAGSAGESLQFSVVGQDRPGIVNQVTTVLSGLGANIETFRAYRRPACRRPWRTPRRRSWWIYRLAPRLSRAQVACGRARPQSMIDSPPLAVCHP
jgi:glycine cleavage system regulatory protein